MGFNNGYDSGYSDCEAENRKRWEREAVERYKAENPPSGGGSSNAGPGGATSLQPVVASWVPDGDYTGYLQVDATAIQPGETIIGQFQTPSGNQPTDNLRFLIPQDVVNVYPRFASYDYGVEPSTSMTLLSPGVLAIQPGMNISQAIDTGEISRLALTRTSTTDAYLWPVDAAILEI